MATQQLQGAVPFSIAHELQQFRLLELPQDLVELLDAPNPPMYAPLRFPLRRSQLPNNSQKPAYAVLCTPHKTFQLRQVQTSNSLFVTRPTDEAHGNQESPVPTTRAVASCAATLELHPSDASPIALLQQTLPFYDAVDGDVYASANRRRKADIFPHLPFSDAECEHAWRTVMAFEHHGSSYRPSASTLAQLWKSVNAAALAEGVKLDGQFLTRDVVDPVAEEGHPESLVRAVLHYLAADEHDHDPVWSCLDRAKTVQFVAKTLLDAKRDGPDYLTADFLDAWKDALPEAWRALAELTAIDGVYELPSSTTIRLKGLGVAATQSETPAAKPSARKWHDKFGRSRKR
ncbi:sister chromatid cohesion protein-like protein Dcc1 [Westerdykella ornata]|uniref:Sister chromatid cohesion protein-like protein Dcc1 n=1 Tax=Westerdykella ornata TaxID=318751 RepID=A0A6A6JRJ6_WESOR|nr:sister chromatid cohesion protein-like protein Dcc1 [Westerdykella ornata]KAF2279017.1 sister chromatid cohesion protein-like protein Dcc1 [Westerdykella ornata]